MAISKDQRAAIGEAVTRLERDFYGRGPSSVRVSTSEGDPEIVTVLSLDTLTVADRTLVDRGEMSSVLAHHDALHLATKDDFCSEVAAIVGDEPDAYFARVDPLTGYAARVFVFDSQLREAD
ncbi:DUF2294 family protein [Egibacter rhizosphaerae]|uniref:DUF2294 family protein n=1 Tax=Egibacter rhizosphaerae TaxID=1670831 RepID=A0A411YAV7_9ACTN|nr:Na-translocating system protein MpsC family protein [Egibacter rhizosphaerae]QBI18312.1 DUF2294 family protein [Egibacter rhizosphaerae]